MTTENHHVQHNPVVTGFYLPAVQKEPPKTGCGWNILTAIVVLNAPFYALEMLCTILPSIASMELVPYSHPVAETQKLILRHANPNRFRVV